MAFPFTNQGPFWDFVNDYHNNNAANNNDNSRRRPRRDDYDSSSSSGSEDDAYNVDVNWTSDRGPRGAWSTRYTHPAGRRAPWGPSSRHDNHFGFHPHPAPPSGERPPPPPEGPQPPTQPEGPAQPQPPTLPDHPAHPPHPPHPAHPPHPPHPAHPPHPSLPHRHRHGRHQDRDEAGPSADFAGPRRGPGHGRRERGGRRHERNADEGRGAWAGRGPWEGGRRDRERPSEWLQNFNLGPLGDFLKNLGDEGAVANLVKNLPEGAIPDFIKNQIFGGNDGVSATAAAAGAGDGTTAATTADHDFVPPVDVFDTEGAYVVHVSLAGAKKEDVSVNWDAEKSELVLAGVVYRPGDEDLLKTLALDERKVGAFERKVKLGSATTAAMIEVEGITAKMEDGVLRVTLPKQDKDFIEIHHVDVD